METQKPTGEDDLNALRAAIEALDIEYAAVIKPFFERRDALMARVEAELPEGTHWQAQDGTVFQIQVPSGKFVSFQRIGYEHTRRAYLGEKKGGLSLKAAEALGYMLGPNQRTVADSTTDGGGKSAIDP